MIKQIAMIAVLGLGVVAASASDVTLTDVEKMEAVWKSSGIVTYSFSPRRHAAFGGSNVPVRVFVAKSKVKEIRTLSGYGDHSVGPKISVKKLRKIVLYPLTVEEAFQWVKECIVENTPLLWVDFDEHYGVPLSWTCGEIETDGWGGVSLSNLEIGMPPNNSLQRP